MQYHLEELEPRGGEIRNFILRVFDDPVGPIDPQTGQPWKRFVGLCNLQLCHGACEIKAIQQMPKTIHPARCLAILRGPVADELDILALWGERWDAERQVKHFVPVPLARRHPPRRISQPILSSRLTRMAFSKNLAADAPIDVAGTPRNRSEGHS